MVRINKFNPSRQVMAFHRLSDVNYISDLSFKKGLRGTYRWSFYMGELVFQYEGQELDLDFRQYRLKVVYSNNAPPKVFVLEPVLPKTTKHLYRDKSLCLYKPANWQWQDEMQFDEELFPNICTWLYHYEIWCKTGNWYGEEAAH